MFYGTIIMMINMRMVVTNKAALKVSVAFRLLDLQTQLSQLLGGPVHLVRIIMLMRITMIMRMIMIIIMQFSLFCLV